MWSKSAIALFGLVTAANMSLLQDGAFAQAVEPSATRGRSLAVRLCSNCHLVDGGAAVPMPVGVGTFRGIANRAGQTAERISNILILPHMPMPDAQLTRDEIQDIITYLETLRTNPDVPPLIAPGSAKPQFPSKT
jgi:mono/diheme cytochrome c family protein